MTLITSRGSPSNVSDRLRYFLPLSNQCQPDRPHAVLVATTLLIASLFFSGCQTIAPFSQTMRTRAAAARQWSGNGIEAFRRGAVEDARECFAKASSQMPRDHRMAANLARTHFQQGELSQAIEVMQRAVEVSNSDPELQVELGEYYLADGQLIAAQRQVDRALSDNHRLASAWLLRGRIHAARGNHQTALGDFQKSLGIDGSREDVQLEIVEAYQSLGDPLRALSAVEQLLEKYPLDRQPESAILAKSAALYQLDQNSSAIEVLTRAADRSDVSSEVFTTLARLQILSGRQTNALRTLTVANDRFPGEPQLAGLLDDLRSTSPTKVASRE
ncbi:tetratricopeptide repeat protein [Mariniblastus fucicola]|uniref:Tetratricopeptide repeat protein n=1 Tax=Mariniblastus fucicola TaxID=980251 RepID=A0A5B9PS72_9BACT|nr:tetratricopeptide repeat protein [Mariniblastus fucicola]QEG25073.1 tetratricopeptide repeat protein [Mariniblastus fucicola]